MRVKWGNWKRRELERIFLHYLWPEKDKSIEIKKVENIYKWNRIWHERDDNEWIDGEDGESLRELSTLTRWNDFIW
jgi:hypothetical protein